MSPDVQESVELWHSEMSERFAGLCPEGSTDSAPVGTVRGVRLGDIGA
ncbi:hypothetical protein [Rhodococcus sp. IEGM 1379]|nr:hypothetical protein [Rhodococcus sp. IEGM 1379]MDI9913974.1 hypothetical protein [Rhodococcus sp. IEGM 1379]